MLFMKSTLALFNNNKLIFSIYFIMPLAEKPFGHQEIVVFTKQSIMNFKLLEVLSSLRLLFLENSLTQFFCSNLWPTRGTEGKMVCNFTLSTNLTLVFFINVGYLYTVKPCFIDTCLLIRTVCFVPRETKPLDFLSIILNYLLIIWTLSMAPLVSVLTGFDCI